MHEEFLNISAFDANSPESLMIEIRPDKSQFILDQFQQNYEMMASSLQIDKKRLILLNPKFVD